MPVLAGGSADGDIEMLASAQFALLVHHDDEKREFAYDKDAEKALASAAQNDWLVVSMKNDFVRVFARDEDPA